MKNIILFSLASAGAIFGFLFGEINTMFYIVVAFMALDYLTGVIAAIVNKELSSSIGWKGIVKKVVSLIILVVAHLLDKLLTDNSGALLTATEIFFIANDGISILENAAKTGIKLPKKLIETLEQLQNGDDEEDD